MKIFKKLIGAGIFLTFSIAVCSINSPTFSWFNSKVLVDDGIFAESGAAYFAGGDGTKSNPFILTNQRHFYNLAWLQYLGYFNRTTTTDGKETVKQQYYFKVNNDIDCNGLAIPPIGTTKYPFIGSFDGHNCTISNFTITDTYKTLVSHPAEIDKDGNDYHASTSDETIKYCSIIGTFGVVGSYESNPSATYDSTITNLSNFYLDNVTISTKTNNVLVGCFAGYVNSTIDNCGVHYVKFDIAGNTKKFDSFNNVSEFTLIGSYNKKKYKYDEDIDSGDTGYGTSTDIRALDLTLFNTKLKDGDEIEVDLKSSDGKSKYSATLDKTKDTSSNTGVDGTYTKVKSGITTTIILNTDGTGTFNGTSFTYVFDSDSMTGTISPFGTYDSSTNSFTFSTTGVISNVVLPFKEPKNPSITKGAGSKTINTYNKDLSISYSDSVSVAEGATNIGYYSGPEIKTYRDYFKKSKSSDNYKVDYDNITIYSGSPVKAISEDVKTYLTTQIDELTRRGDSVLALTGKNYLGSYEMAKADSYNLISNAQIGSYSGDLLLPNRCIWVAPVKSGNFEIVLVNEKTTSSKLAIWKLQRKTPKDYSTGFKYSQYDYTVQGIIVPAYSGSGAYIPYYYGITVTQEDIDNGYEFVITKYIESSNVFITYIDIGANGDDSPSDDRISLANFDFVTKEEDNSLTKIKTYDSSTSSYVDNSSYKKSNVTFKIGDTTTETIIAFRRLAESSGGVLYYQYPTILTPSSTGTKTESSKEDCKI